MLIIIIAVIALVTTLGMIKVMPFYTSLVGLATFIIGLICGYHLSKTIKEKEVIIGAPSEIRKVKRAKKVASK